MELRGDFMGLFDIFKKKTLVVQPKTYTCARCKKEITDAETKCIGNHRFCADCAAPPKTSTLEKHFENEAQEAGYQAYMDFARGSLTPEQAYSNRGFVKDQNGNWVYGKLQTKDTFICSKCGKELKKKYLHKNNTCITCVTTSSINNVPKKQENAPNRTICLFHEGDQYQGTHIELTIKNDNEICIQDTGWWPVHRGASNGGCITTNLDADYFQKNTIDDFIAFLSSEKKQDFSHLKNRADINALFRKKNERIFKMITKEGLSHNFSYLDHTRYSPNRSSTCGYGSDDWMYLCKENDRYYLLIFSDDASYGTGWMCTELLNGDSENLVKEDVNYWCSVAHSKERTKTYAIRLTDVDSVRHLLPTSSRCCSKLTDEYYLR